MAFFLVIWATISHFWAVFITVTVPSLPDRDPPQIGGRAAPPLAGGFQALLYTDQLVVRAAVTNLWAGGVTEAARTSFWCKQLPAKYRTWYSFKVTLLSLPDEWLSRLPVLVAVVVRAVDVSPLDEPIAGKQSAKKSGQQSPNLKQEEFYWQPPRFICGLFPIPGVIWNLPWYDFACSIGGFLLQISKKLGQQSPTSLHLRSQ